jgi:hypothetical protein
MRAGCPATPPRSALEVATIVRAHGAALRRQLALSREQRQALRAIAVCRTPALGGHVDVCTACGFERPAYHSCRNRHGPKCQSLAQARWITQRMARVLDTDYFHVVERDVRAPDLALADQEDDGGDEERLVGFGDAPALVARESVQGGEEVGGRIGHPPTMPS